MGLFADGTTADLMQSTLTTFRSDNVGVATVGRYGLVRGVAPGFARIVIENGNAKVEVPFSSYGMTKSSPNADDQHA